VQAISPPDGGAATPADPKPPEVKRAPPPPGAETVTSRLAQTFGQQKAKITGCFKQHAVDVSGAPELSIRIEIGTDGSVTSAELAPAELAATELGKCILAVTRATRFDPQPEPVAFRVPIKAKVRE
jgi:hypothetical protein